MKGMKKITEDRRNDVMELRDNVSISRLERQEEQSRQREEEQDWMQYFEYLVNHDGERG